MDCHGERFCKRNEFFGNPIGYGVKSVSRNRDSACETTMTINAD
jgi:hypothetical protein